MNGYVSIPLMLCLILSTWSSMASSKKVNQHISGEEMFRGVFFAEGQFAELIPELKATQIMYSSNQLSVNEKKALAWARTQIIASIKASNPHYFDDFKVSIQTDNPVLIKEKLMEGQKIVAKNALRLSNLKEPDLKSLDSFLAKEGKNVDKKALHQFMKKLSKEGYSKMKANSGSGVMQIQMVYVLDAFATEVTNYQSILILEQMVNSICNVVPKVV